MIGYGNSMFLGSTLLSGGGVTPFTNEYSMSFDGVDEYFNGASTFSALDGQNKMTLSCWVKPTLNSTDEVLSCGYASGVLFQLRIYSSGIVRFQLNTTSFYTTTGAGAISANVWSHILICIDKTQASNTDRGRIFINGVEGQTNNLDTSLIGTSTTPLYIGIGYGLTLPYGGFIDEVAMWVGSDERTNAATIYNAGSPSDLSQLATPPQHWWRMGDGDSWTGSQWTLNDNIGSYNLDSVNMEEGDRVTDVPPNFNLYSMSFDGVDEYIQVADADNLSFGNGTTDSPFSFSAWVKMNDASFFRILSKLGNNSNDNEYALFTSGSDQLFFQLYDSNTTTRRNRYYTTALTSFQGQWIHIVATYSGVGGTNAQDGIKLYLNGNRVDNASGTFGSYVSMHNTTAPLEIGKLTTSYSNGLIDEVAIFSSELSSTDVTNMYNGGTPTDLTSLSPLSWWRMGDGDTWNGSTWTFTDNGSGGNDGTSVNMEVGDRTTDKP